MKRKISPPCIPQHGAMTDIAEWFRKDHIGVRYFEEKTTPGICQGEQFLSYGRRGADSSNLSVVPDFTEYISLSKKASYNVKHG